MIIIIDNWYLYTAYYVLSYKYIYVYIYIYMLNYAEIKNHINQTWLISFVSPYAEVADTSQNQY